MAQARSTASKEAAMSRVTRRHFLTALGLGGVGAAAALAAPRAPERAAEVRQPDAGSKSRGYQATPHVRQYYRTARV
jgi:hypothetical protein